MFGTDYTEALAADSRGAAEDVEQEHIKSAAMKDAPESKIVTSVEEVYRLEGSGLWVAEPFTEPGPGEPFEVRVWRRTL